MNKPAARRSNGQQQRPYPVDVWTTPAPLPEFVPITIPADVLTMLRSLGEPPLNGRVDARLHIERVISRAAVIATALALSADALAEPL